MSPHYTRESLLELLRRYYPLTDDRLPVLERLIAFVESTPMCAERSNIYGHLTGSAWVVNSDRSKALLLHHRKLNRWVSALNSASLKNGGFSIEMLGAIWI
jgi:hypothetical protein